jgi:hypothetical protein
MLQYPSFVALGTEIQFLASVLIEKGKNNKFLIKTKKIPEQMAAKSRIRRSKGKKNKSTNRDSPDAWKYGRTRGAPEAYSLCEGIWR